jgi:hypothetical protein
MTLAERMIAKVPTLSLDEARRVHARAIAKNEPALAAACDAHIAALGANLPRAKSNSDQRGQAQRTPAVAEAALALLIEDYQAGKDPTTYRELADRLGFHDTTKLRWFGQVTDLIDAACAYADVPSFALLRVLTADGQINQEAWSRPHQIGWRDKIIAKANAANWTDADFDKIRNALGFFASMGFGNIKAWAYVGAHRDVAKWATA